MITVFLGNNSGYIILFYRIHFETSSVLIHQMPLELVRRPLGWKDGPITAGKTCYRIPTL